MKAQHTLRVGTVHAIVIASLSMVMVSISPAQLVDSTQVTPTVPGGTIEESLHEQIGTGRGHVNKPLSSIYLIKRDPARAIRRGRQLFQRKFTDQQGVGPRVSPHSTGNIMESPALGAGLADSCAACHGRPKGSAGFGGVVTTRPDSRDAPHLFGLGLQEMLADEMTQTLRDIHDQTVADVLSDGVPRQAALVAKGVSFGTLDVAADGSVDTSSVEGVDEDLRVRPFFAQGGAYAMREFIVGAFKDEMGMESPDPVMGAASDGHRVVTPAGLVLDGGLDSLNAPPVRSPREDGDRDGVRNEVDPALVDFLEFYLLNYFKPGIGKQTARSDEGRDLMVTAKCTSCHVPDLTVDRDRRIADVSTQFDPENGRFNRLYATAATRFVIHDDGNTYPQLLPEGESFVVENFYADMKRHDLGPAFHERNFDGTMLTQTVTEPLWGVGSTPPYGRDGRSINLEEVILRHGGEAQESKELFVALDDDDQHKIIEFLNTLVLFPPDDTASNLNPGSDDEHIQSPAGHGTINLGALFQIDDLGTLPRHLGMRRHGERCTFSWHCAENCTYTVEQSHDLVTWKALYTTNAVRTGFVDVDLNVPAERCYFRLRHN